MNYTSFIREKSQFGAAAGFAPLWMPDFLFDFQAALLDWAIRLGRCALFEDCGLGKTPQQLVWCENGVRKTNKPSLLVTCLAVSAQTILEGEKFGIDVQRSRDGKPGSNITVTNYEQLHKFDWRDFGSIALDESSILKNFDGALRTLITEFMRKIPYRSLWTATAAPNDFVELGCSSEAIGHLGYIDMLNTFFKNDGNNSATKRTYGEAPAWRFRGHAEQKFWRWVTSWARAIRKPQDIGFPNGAFELPALVEREHIVELDQAPAGALFGMPETTLDGQRAEGKRALRERCECAAALVADTGEPAAMWCHTNPEGNLLEELIPDAVQVSGRDRDEAKEEKFIAFGSGQARVIITKPKIGAFGLNWQHCSHIVEFPSHSYEQYYQLVRRCWRFGQQRPVRVDSVLTAGERLVAENRRRKAAAADLMFENLVAEMNHAIGVRSAREFVLPPEVPAWL